MKTYAPKPEHIQRRWYVLDASEQVLGRVATEAAHILRGKHKPIYAPHADVGDHVIIVNASKVVLTGGKERKKVAYRHSGHPGGITATLYEDLLAKRPAFAVEKAVRGMLPKNRLGRAMIKKLHVEAGPEHRHRAQKPEAWALGMRPAWTGLPTPEPAATAEPRKTDDDGASPASTAKRASSRKTTATKKTATERAQALKRSTRKPAAAQKTTTSKKTTATARKTTATKKPTAAKKPAGRAKKET